MKSWSAYFKILLHSLKEFRIHEYNSFNLFVMASCYAGQIGHSFFPLLFCLVFLSIRHWGLKIPFMWCQPPIILFFLFRYAFCNTISVPTYFLAIRSAYIADSHFPLCFTIDKCASPSLCTLFCKKYSIQMIETEMVSLWICFGVSPEFKPYELPKGRSFRVCWIPCWALWFLPRHRSG